ncbi:hypothetical protein WJX72_009499 [[Myrmecia] bisecta]|uniref:Uncharacterized protein n=1 Tax=[Myrmecia] bisecta TaxID=41462 RepID=A0AAW1PE80_9CHLO
MEAGQDLPLYLQQFEPYGGLVVNWRMFGSSGLVTRPAGGTLGNFWACAPAGDAQNTHVKTIANTKYTLRSGPDPHHFVYSGPIYAVNEQFQRVDGPRTDAPSFQHIALHHYALKSLEEFQQKINRGQAHGEIGKTLEFFDAVDASTTARCADALHFGGQFGALAPLPSSQARRAS